MGVWNTTFFRYHGRHAVKRTMKSENELIEIVRGEMGFKRIPVLKVLQAMKQYSGAKLFSR
jgi:hypothetical protein